MSARGMGSRHSSLASIQSASQPSTYEQPEPEPQSFQERTDRHYRSIVMRLVLCVWLVIDRCRRWLLVFGVSHRVVQCLLQPLTNNISVAA